MTEKTWTRKDISEVTIRKFTPPTYNSNGYDKNGYNIDGMDRFGNYRSTGLRYCQTILLQRIASWGADTLFTREDIIVHLPENSASIARLWHMRLTRTFDALVAKGVIVRDGQHCVLSSTGHALLEEIAACKEQAEAATQPNPES